MVESMDARGATIIKILKSKTAIKILKQSAKAIAIIIIDETFRRKL